MKTIIIFFLFSVLMFAQNPDKNPSFHLTTYTMTGSADYTEGAGLGYYEYQPKLNFKFEVKYPISDFTISAFYQTQVIKTDFTTKYYFYNNAHLNGSIQTFGTTISYYLE